MDNGVDSAAPEVSAETQRLAELGRQGTVEFRDPLAPQTFERPEGVPEKFWDPLTGKVDTDALLKSYGELEKTLGGRKADPAPVEGQAPEAAETPKETEEKPEGDTEETTEDTAEEKQDGEEKPEDEEKEEAQAPALTDAIEAAQAVYAETGELPEEARQPLLDAGISNEQIDFYLQGVKAAEQALFGAAYEAAGGEETYKEAVAWAAENWTEKQILAFNAATGDPKTVRMVVKGLMEDYRSANPSEGTLTNTTTGISRGDVYNDIREFHAELALADKLRDPLKRSQAIAKMKRSREAGTVTSNRRQPFGG